MDLKQQFESKKTQIYENYKCGSDIFSYRSKPSMKSFLEEGQKLNETLNKNRSFHHTRNTSIENKINTNCSGVLDNNNTNTGSNNNSNKKQKVGSCELLDYLQEKNQKELMRVQSVKKEMGQNASNGGKNEEKFDATPITLGEYGQEKEKQRYKVEKINGNQAVNSQYLVDLMQRNKEYLKTDRKYHLNKNFYQNYKVKSAQTKVYQQQNSEKMGKMEDQNKNIEVSQFSVNYSPKKTKQQIREEIEQQIQESIKKQKMKYSSSNSYSMGQQSMYNSRLNDNNKIEKNHKQKEENNRSISRDYQQKSNGSQIDVNKIIKKYEDKKKINTEKSVEKDRKDYILENQQQQQNVSNRNEIGAESQSGKKMKSPIVKTYVKDIKGISLNQQQSQYIPTSSNNSAKKVVQYVKSGNNISNVVKPIAGLQKIVQQNPIQIIQQSHSQYQVGTPRFAQHLENNNKQKIQQSETKIRSYTQDARNIQQPQQQILVVRKESFGQQVQQQQQQLQTSNSQHSSLASSVSFSNKQVIQKENGNAVDNKMYQSYQFVPISTQSIVNSQKNSVVLNRGQSQEKLGVISTTKNNTIQQQDKSPQKAVIYQSVQTVQSRPVSAHKIQQQQQQQQQYQQQKIINQNQMYYSNQLQQVQNPQQQYQQLQQGYYQQYGYIKDSNNMNRAINSTQSSSSVNNLQQRLQQYSSNNNINNNIVSNSRNSISNSNSNSNNKNTKENLWESKYNNGRLNIIDDNIQINLKKDQANSIYSNSNNNNEGENMKYSLYRKYRSSTDQGSRKKKPIFTNNNTNSNYDRNNYMYQY